MKIILVILCIIIAVLILLLVSPLMLDLNFEKQLTYKIKYWGITFFNSEKKVELKRAKNNKRKNKYKNKHKHSQKQSDEGFLKKTYNQKGLLGTIEYLSKLFAIVFKKLWWVVRRFKFRKFKFDLSVSTPDAANTAIQYGRICSVIYPVLSFLNINTDLKSKEINISADFDKTESEFGVSLSVTTRLIFWLVAATAVLFRFLKLQRKEREKYERKQS